jgi:hypothetical protein
MSIETQPENCASRLVALFGTQAEALKNDILDVL